MSIRDIVLVVVAIAFLVTGVILGVEGQKQRTQPVIVDRIVERVVTQNVTEYVDRPVYIDREIVKQIPYLVVYPVETTFLPYFSDNLSFTDVIVILTKARDYHQYYIDHPEKQTPISGDTAFNQMWVNNYNAIEAFTIDKQN